MKIIRSTPKANGATRLIIELAANEHIVSHTDDQEVAVAAKGEAIIKLDPSGHYKLGEPMHEDVIAGHILADAKPVHWCSLGQEWVG